MGSAMTGPTVPHIGLEGHADAQLRIQLQSGFEERLLGIAELAKHIADLHQVEYPRMDVVEVVAADGAIVELSLQRERDTWPGSATPLIEGWTRAPRGSGQ